MNSKGELIDMALRITSVEPGSPAHRSGIRDGHSLVEINGQPVHDRLDAQFFLHDERVVLTVQDQQGRLRKHEICKDYQDDAGLNLPPIRPRTCRNRCIFCFVDQLPRGLRKSLYLKDEDYRLSFLQGSYVTLTDLTGEEIDRIIRQRLSPLYLSVHSTDREIREKLLRRKKIPDIMGIIEQLARSRIQMHTQVVLCPGINDGEILRRTVEDLAGFFPAVRSVAVVPVGLTGHRQGLYPLQPVTRQQAGRLIESIESWQERYRDEIGLFFVHAADELYLLAGRPVPEAGRYEGFEQLENGVGMIRQWLDRFEESQKDFPRSVPRPRTITVVTGYLAAPLIQQTLVDRLSRVKGLTVHLQVVENRLFGGGVTVSGLLAGEDIIQALQTRPAGDMVLLPPNCLNEQGFFLDDLTPENLAERLELEIVVTDRNDPLGNLEKVFS